MRRILTAIGLLTLSNIFMNIAWYGHLKYKNAPIVPVIFASWGIAFFEYCLQVPANRIGDQVLSIVQLKVAQEVITLFTFSLIAALFLGQKLQWNNFVSFGLIILAAWFSFHKF